MQASDYVVRGGAVFCATHRVSAVRAQTALLPRTHNQANEDPEVRIFSHTVDKGLNFSLEKMLLI